VVLVPLIASWEPPGQSLLTGIIVLAIMILPTVALLTIAALEQVPLSLIRSSVALGFSPAGSLRKVILPAAKSGIATAIVLAVARAIGETMAVLMVCGNVIQLPATVFDPVRTLTANIALEMAYALDIHRSALFVSGLVLIVIVAGLVLCAEVIRMRERHV
jgi:phosphate transport system permease protein